MSALLEVNKDRCKVQEISGSDSHHDHSDCHLPPDEPKVSRSFEYALCMDIEATCDHGRFDLDSHEVIEFGIALVELSSGKILDTFQTLVKPTRVQKLSDFCVKYTNITDEQLKSAPSFVEALGKIDTWIGRQTVLDPAPLSIKCLPPRRSDKVVAGEKGTGPQTCHVPRNFVWITHGLADFERFLGLKSCTINKTPLPPYMLGRYIDLMQTYAEFRHRHWTWKQSLSTMCDYFRLKFTGRKHSALDDAKCVAKVFMCMLKRDREKALICNAYIDMDSPDLWAKSPVVYKESGFRMRRSLEMSELRRDLKKLYL